MTEERVASNTHNMVQRLEDLRIEHVSLINSLESPKTEKSDIILKNIKYIDVGLDEAELMMEFSAHLQNVEIEKQQLNAQIKQLTQENDNLRDDLSASHEKLRIFEKMIIDFENVKEDKGLKLAICTQTGDDQNLGIPMTVPFIESSDLVPDELIDDDSDSTLTPRASNKTVDEESEALSRFKSLQSLAINYASEGNYEVAILLCKQAVDNLEKTTVGRFHPYVTRMMSIVGLVYGVQNKYKAATELLHDAIREKTQPFTFGSA